MKNRLRKIIRKEIDFLFETLAFQNTSAEQIAIDMTHNIFPKKGVDDMINNFNELQWEIDQKESQEEREKDNEQNFAFASANSGGAVTRTNIYESDLEEGQSIYGSTNSAQHDLDWSSMPLKNIGMLDADAQKEVDLQNDNISRSLNEVPPGDSRVNGAVNNKVKNF